ncbi:IDEAL domain-containing protein [Bacillus infantis]|uniref:IDEAL domain-containing protein n=1 Tax=Bacillus infantis TaxID=324767 RepID=UPI001CD4C595|nr:IDEAL domain-containing protein [Bacillus infantis]MCA1038072.1 IDEAL domain-containing protein [Bacillus infantis]
MNNQDIIMGGWITGKSRNGELVQGFVEAAVPERDFVTVFVVDSDNPDVIGRKVHIEKKKAEKMKSHYTPSADGIRSLIDTALLTRDKEWFMELSEALKHLEQAGTGNKEIAAGSGSISVSEGRMNNR